MFNSNTKTYWNMHTPDHKNKHVRKEFDPVQGSGYYQRDKTRLRTLYWTVREIIQWTLAIIPWRSFAASNSEGTNWFFSRSFSVLFNFLPPRTNWSVLNIFSTSVTCKFLNLVRKWHHNPDDSTDITFRLILSVLLFSLIWSCVIHHLLWHLFFAAQFQGQMICFHY